MKKQKKVNLNLGCGDNVQKDFINYDIVKPFNADKSFIQGDAREMPFEKESIDYILCDQVLEHIPLVDIVTVLHEIRRILKKGGQCIIQVPDFTSAVQDWLSVNMNEGFDPITYHYVTEVIYGNQQHEGEYHKTAMSAGLLHYSLNVAGLKNHKIKLFPKNGEIPIYEGMRNSPPSARLRNSQLVCEIIK